MVVPILGPSWKGTWNMNCFFGSLLDASGMMGQAILSYCGMFGIVPAE